MLRLFVIAGILIVAIIATVFVMSIKQPISVADMKKTKSNLLIGSDKNIQGNFNIGYVKCYKGNDGLDFASIFAKQLNLRARLNVSPVEIKLDSDMIFELPMIIISGQGKYKFSDSEKANLEAYLNEKGGFLLVDAQNSDFKQSIISALRSINLYLQEFSPGHEIYQSWYQIKDQRLIANTVRSKDRFVGIIPENIDYWVFQNLFTSDKADENIKFAVNIVAYALKHSPIVEWQKDEPVVLTAKKDKNRIVVKAYIRNDSGLLTLKLFDLDGKVVAQKQKSLSSGKKYKTKFKISEDTEFLGQHILKYSWETEDYQYENNVKLGEFIGELNTRILGQTKWYAGSPASLRLVALKANNGIPIAGVKINAKLTEKDTDELISEFSGMTNSQGTVDMRFELPENVEENTVLNIKVDSPNGKDEIKEEIMVKKKYKILLSTDKPIYQPSQTIHIRTLALNTATLKPLGNSNTVIEVEDSKGNKVFKYKADTDKFGISAADFTLADEINMGRYTIRAIMENVTQEKKVNVERYVLPKFKMDFSTNKDFYKPGETVKGELQVDYFFGKPVENGKVTIKASKFDVGFDEFVQNEGKTDKNGHYTFEMELPEYFVGQPLEQGNSFVMFEITVIDQAEHEEKITQNRSVVKSPINIVVVPESGEIVPNVENIIYVMTTYPDGTPAETEITIHDKASEEVRKALQTDSLGVATCKIIPRSNHLSLLVKAVDEKGNRAEREQDFQTEKGNHLLLRTDEALYKVGDIVHAEVFSGKQTGSVYIDLIKAKQTILTKSVMMEKGRGTVDIHLSAGDFGTLEMHAYQITQGDIVRDTRLIFVEQADELKVRISTDKQVYLPGEEANLNFEVTDKNGHPVLAALGIRVVDESVFALQEMQPGLEKVYFTLEKELLKPKYEIHGYTMEQVVTKPVEQIERRQTAAKVLLASVGQILPEYSIELSTYEQKQQEYRETMQNKMKAKVEKIQKAYMNNYRKIQPTSQNWDLLEKLVEKDFLDKEDVLDFWGNPFFVSYNGEIGSVGPDGLLNTDDDIIVELLPRPVVRIMAKMEDRLAGREIRFGKENAFAMIEQRRRGGVVREKLAMLGAEGESGQQSQAQPVSAHTKGMASDKKSSPVPEEPRIRQYFPETLFDMPNLITDEDGKANLSIPMADSITTWRLTSMASSLNGKLGSQTAGIRVFQDFFIDIDLPVSLTQNDEVSIPIAIYNYLPSAQNIRLKLTQEPWFELQEGDAERNVELQKDQVNVIYYRLKVKEIDWHKLTVHAYGDKMSDAISRQIEVVPDGKERRVSMSDRLESQVEQKVIIPANAIDGASKVLVKVYPGVFSQVMEGLENILQMPFGCFEQTTATTYPNVLALEYMKKTKQSTPETQMKAEEYINLGYQRLLSFEVEGGGFSWFGNPPANRALTAYGLMQFHDMAKVYAIDPNLIKRTQEWLVEHQQDDGSWKPDESYLHAESWRRIQNSNLLPTAYILWGLLESEYKGEVIQKGVNYARKHLEETDCPYTLAIVANALVRFDKKDDATEEVMEKLKNMAIEKKDTACWESKIDTITHSHGNSANIETTAMIAQALIKYGKHSTLTNKALTYLIRAKDNNGAWGGTQATIMTLKALLMSVGMTTEEMDATVKISINGVEAERLGITPENSDVMRLVDLEQHTVEGTNTVQLNVEGEGSCMYQVIGKYYMPWAIGEKPKTEPLSIDVDYDKQKLEKNDLITCNVTVVNKRPAQANMLIVDLGIPPGFEVQSEALSELVSKGTIEKFSITNRQIILYFDKLEPNQEVEFKYSLKAKFPIKAKTRLSRVYEYYNPEIESFAEPVEIVVED